MTKSQTCAFLILALAASVGTASTVASAPPSDTTAPLDSLRIIAILPRASGSILLQAVGAANRVYQVQASDNLRNWSGLATVRADAGGNLAYDDPRPANVGMRFYRFVLENGGAGTQPLLSEISELPDDRLPVPDAIREEANRSNSSALGRPLPLTGLWATAVKSWQYPDGRWHTGLLESGFTPQYQLGLVRQGHYVIPTFQLPDPDVDLFEVGGVAAYFEEALRDVAALRLPISFASGISWERYLTSGNNPARSANTVYSTSFSGGPYRLSPFGNEADWAAAGERYTRLPIYDQLRAWYPEPPKVLLVPDNEARRLDWWDAPIDPRFWSYGVEFSDDPEGGEGTRALFAQRWTSLYRAFLGGVRSQLPGSWASRSLMVGYNDITPKTFGRGFDRIPVWGRESAWQYFPQRTISYFGPGNIDPWSRIWDGVSAEDYMQAPYADNRAFGSTVEIQNWVFVRDEIQRYNNPEYWFELSVWDGGNTATNPRRYAGRIQFSMWLLRPRLVREFRNADATRDAFEGHLKAVVSSVDKVHDVPVLRSFWRGGTLVANTGREHLYNENVPPEYRDRARWFMLDTNLDPPRPWTVAIDNNGNQSTVIPVFALAIVKGTAPRREWLVYAHSPDADQLLVNIKVPDFGEVRVLVTQEGTFHVISEESQAVSRIETPGP